MSESADVVAARLAAAAPDAPGVAELAAVEGELSDDGAWDGVRALDRQIAWLQARQLGLLARAAAAVPSTGLDDNHDWAQEELSCALTISANAAGTQLELARLLARRPTVAALLARGDIALAHVRVLADETRDLELAQAALVDADVLQSAARQTPPSFRRTVKRAVLRHVPVRVIDERYATARDQRCVAGAPAEYGMVQLRALLPAEDYATVLAAVDAVARRVGPGDSRTADQRRADALTQICAAVLTGTPVESLRTEHRVRPAVHVVAAESTLAGADDEPAELDGQPIPASVARRLAADPSATFHRTDGSGRAFDYGRSVRRPPAALAELVIARDRTCVFPGCNRAARRCDIDHRTRWSHGGTTKPENLQALCRRHHRAKDLAGWRCALLPDGTIRWTSLTGRTYLRAPKRYPAQGPAPPAHDAA